MSSATRFAVVASLVGLIGAARRAPDASSGTTPSPARRADVTVSTASLTFFTDRAAFQARASQLALEDFAKGKFPLGPIDGCPGPLDASSNNTCFSTGSIQPGVQFNSGTPHDQCATGCELAMVQQGAFSGSGVVPLVPPSNTLTVDAFTDAFVINFTPNVNAVGADLVAYFVNSTCSIEISGASGVLLGTTTAPCTNPGTFWGVIADQPISRIRIAYIPLPSGPGAAGVANIAFGAGAPTTIPVVLDIKPGSDVSPINPRSQGVTPVAVLSTTGFDASQIDVSSVAFGPGGAPAVHSDLQDVNSDGLPDLLLHFETQAAQIVCGATQASLTGRTRSGRQIIGTGALVTVGCD